MSERLNGSRFAARSLAEPVAMKDVIATIKVKALLEFSRTNPEFQKELSLNAAKAARFRGVELNDFELELLVTSIGRLQT